MLWLNPDYPTNIGALSPSVVVAGVTTSGVPAQIEAQARAPNSKVVFSNIKQTPCISPNRSDPEPPTFGRFVPAYFCPGLCPNADRVA